MAYAILILFVASMALMVNWAAAKRFQEIADMKGHNGEDYFWWCFWLGLCGWAMVMAQPDRRNGQAGAVLPNDDLPAL